MVEEGRGFEAIFVKSPSRFLWVNSPPLPMQILIKIDKTYEVLGYYLSNTQGVLREYCDLVPVDGF
jgi:hypothetical protein